MANPRKLAVSALLKVENDGAYSNITLNHLFESAELTAEEKRMTTALFYGVLERKLTLDAVLSTMVKSPLRKTPPYTLQVLRTGLYQIMFMDGIPAFSAVDESVKLIKKSKENRSAGFVNALLRKAAGKENLLPAGDDPDALSIRYSCPRWIVDTLLSDYGIEDTKGILEESLKPAPLILRVNTMKTTPAELLAGLVKNGIKGELCEGFNNAVQVSRGFDIAKSPLYKKGLFHVQDLASQSVAAALSPKPGERILDLCAAPGGKSFTMAQLMENEGEIVSCDLYEQRTGLIAEGAKRLGLPIIKPQTADGSVFNPALGAFDAVLCDVPCSGLGVMRRKPDIKYKPCEDFGALGDIQKRLLSTASQYVAAGGRLIYSTCTLRAAENTQVTGAFLGENDSFHLTYERTYLPHKDKTDGFYCAVMERGTH